jgi:hypothetical protein
VYDSVSNEDLLIPNGGDVYIHAAPVLAGITGNYQLNINVSREQSLGLEDIIDENHIIMYPNPASGVVNFKIQNNDITFSELNIVNSLGQVIKKQEIGNNLDFSIDVNYLPNGFYFLYFHSQKLDFVKKLVIDRD